MDTKRRGAESGENTNMIKAYLDEMRYALEVSLNFQDYENLLLKLDLDVRVDENCEMVCEALNLAKRYLEMYFKKHGLEK